MIHIGRPSNLADDIGEPCDLFLEVAVDRRDEIVGWDAHWIDPLLPDEVDRTTRTSEPWSG
jgi:hypothetical protein